MLEAPAKSRIVGEVAAKDLERDDLTAGLANAPEDDGARPEADQLLDAVWTEPRPDPERAGETITVATGYARPAST